MPKNENLNKAEKMLVEAIGGLFQNDENVLGMVPHEERSHFFEYQWNGIEDVFALKTAKSNFHEELTGAFRDIHSYKYLDDPTFSIALEKRLTARGVPTEEIKEALKYYEEVKEELLKENFQEKSAGWNPNLDEILDTTRNAHNRTPPKEAPFTGGGPWPAKDEIG